MRSLATKIGVLAIAAVGTLGMAYAEQQVGMESGKRAPVLTAIPSNAMTITNWYKQNVYDSTGKTIGEVADVLISGQGNVEALIISVGGFLGIGDKDVAVPFNAVAAGEKDGKWRLTMSTTKDVLKGAPGYKYDRSKTTWVSAFNQ